MSQLILTLDDNLLQAAQEYARQHGQELDALVAEWLKTTVQPAAEPPLEAQPAQAFSPRIQRLFGAVKVPADFDYKKVLEEAILERHGL